MGIHRDMTKFGNTSDHTKAHASLAAPAHKLSQAIGKLAWGSPRTRVCGIAEQGFALLQPWPVVVSPAALAMPRAQTKPSDAGGEVSAAGGLAEISFAETSQTVCIEASDYRGSVAKIKEGRYGDLGDASYDARRRSARELSRVPVKDKPQRLVRQRRPPGGGLPNVQRVEGKVEPTAEGAEAAAATCSDSDSDADGGVDDSCTKADSPLMSGRDRPLRSPRSSPLQEALRPPNIETPPHGSRELSQASPGEFSSLNSARSSDFSLGSPNDAALAAAAKVRMSSKGRRLRRVEHWVLCAFSSILVIGLLALLVWKLHGHAKDADYEYANNRPSRRL